MQIVSFNENLPERTNSIFWKKKNFKMSSAEIFTQSAKS